MTDAVHVVVPPRWSVTVTMPIWPLIMLEVVEATCDPRETAAVGALIDSAPAVSVKLTGVAAAAGRAVAAVSVTTVPARTRSFRIIG
jgi:hypothetical protein